ncbi:MAG: hypothetical protein KAI28_02950, partial [Sphingomonadales bacterium]|nr:hypothetical protein [Sphingomonadales bacterium]
MSEDTMADEEQKQTASEVNEPDPSADPALLADREEGDGFAEHEPSGGAGEDGPSADPSISAVHTGSRSSSAQTAVENETRVDLVDENEVVSEEEEEQRQDEAARQLQLDEV